MNDAANRTEIAGRAIPERRAVLAAGAAALILLLALALPDDPFRLTPSGFARLPLEFALLVGLLAILGPRWRMPVSAAAGLLLALLVLAKLASLATHAAYGRPPRPALDLALLPAAWNLSSGALGAPLAFAAAAALAAAAAGLAFLLFRASRALARVLPALPPMAPAGFAAASAALFLAAGAGGPVSAGSSRFAAAQAASAYASLADGPRFRSEAAHDPFASIPDADLLADLHDRDVALIFVESYGRSALESPRFAAGTRAALEAADSEIAGAGFSAASGWLSSPTVGGLSWLAHATLLSGLRIADQNRYDALVTSRRATLVSDFARAGWRTVAVVPAITMAWPEGRFFGYDRILDAAALDYAGRPFNWITMPDQFTLKRFRDRELAPTTRQPVFAEIALISSHAPWTPIPPVIDWDAIGDGTIFDRWAESGDPPEVVWRDPERIRSQYGLSIDYVLRTIGSFVARYRDPNLVLIVVGDHQPAPLVTGAEAGADVPIHVISADPKVLQAAADWGFSPGLLPEPEAAALPMEDLRARILESFTPRPSRALAAAPDAIPPRPGPDRPRTR
ncbi:sulfatase-like hydrolase/transferase [Propylenella binzhouense]|uniref:Sulfatase n=1 Tax=Propylenella binzhouense TaxID=2555902 RepID=A0A964WVK0_9HYPH|nr:sulfatase-like hydrolase/transferase [Propylenella binzhouense]MYZ50317.1 sulfatase [Propylenella binzhouense]